VKAGRAVLAVRVFDRFATGGFTGPASAMWVRPAADKDGAVALTGTWKFAIEYSVPHERPTPPIPPVIPGESPNAPGVLYNGMLHGLRRMGMRGAIWYQGESNADRAAEYRALLPALIRSWREIWNGSEFPFGIVQLANWMPRQDQPGKSAWAELREAQTMTADTLPNCGLALAVDIGDAIDIHPTNKQDVGKRLALWALAKVYGRAGEYSGPVFESMTTAGDSVRVKFAHAEGGLATQDGGAVAGFAVAGEDGKFAWADATIDGTSVVLRSKQVGRPAAVRYAWADNPKCNLCNKARLPAVPFRTDGK
jgi:sialate O-acetylesterase